MIAGSSLLAVGFFMRVGCLWDVCGMFVGCLWDICRMFVGI